MKCNFAITYFSPIHPEMEICRRIEVAAKNLGCQCYFVGQDGIILQNGKHISDLDIDFLLVFDPAHICIFDTFVYHLMWFCPGLVSNSHAIPYQKFSLNCDDHLCFPSKVALEFYDHCYSTVNPNYLYPSVPKNYMLKPKRLGVGFDKRYKAFYAGINVDSKTVRHEAIFRYLDKRDLVDLYGPKFIDGKQNWVDFKSYKGEIKFDGHSLMQCANDAGVTLALHHEIHAKFAMPTNRIFEGLAAGTLVITDRMTFVEKEFGDTVFMLDSNLSQDQKARKIHEILDWANSHPDEAYAKAIEAQEIFKKKFELTEVLRNIVCQHPARSQELLKDSLQRCGKQLVSVIVDAFDLDSLTQQIQNVAKQDYPHIKMIIIDRGVGKEQVENICLQYCKEIHYEIYPVQEQVIYTDTIPFNLLEYLRTQNLGTICFSAPNQYWHHNHIRSLVEKMVLQGADVVYAGSYFVDDSGKQIPIVHDVILDFDNKLLNVFSSERDYLYNIIQIELPRSSLLFNADLLGLFDENEVKFAYAYEHLVLTLLAFINNRKIKYSSRVTLRIPSRPIFEDAENDRNYYFKPLRLNARMSFNRLHFVLNQVFAKNESLREILEKQRATFGINSSALEWRIDSKLNSLDGMLASRFAGRNVKLKLAFGIVSLGVVVVFCISVLALYLILTI